MRRAALVLLLAAAPAWAGSQSVCSKHRTLAPPVADLLNETFQATGYDDGTGANAWTDPCTVNCGTRDPDETVLCPVGTGFGTQCFESTASGANKKAYVVNELAVAQTGPVWITVYFDLHGMGAWADGQTQVIVAGVTTVAAGPDPSPPSASTAAFAASLVYDVGGTMGGTKDACSVAPCFRLELKIGGVTSTATSAYTEIFQNTVYRLRFQVDNTNGAGVDTTGAAFVNGTQIVFNGDSAFSYRYTWIGQPEYSLAAETILFGKVTVGTGGYVD